MIKTFSPASPTNGFLRGTMLLTCLTVGSVCLTTGRASAANAHPLDRALGIAQETLNHVEAEVQDYTAVITKRERLNGQLAEAQQMLAKIRHQQTVGNRVTVPKSVYLKFLKPDSLKGREVIWVDGKHDGKLIAHETGFKNLFRYKLAPDGAIAMYGQRYPVTKIGVRNLLVELLERGERERKLSDDCSVKLYKNAKVDGRPCRVIEVLNPTKSPQHKFYRARVYIDNELQIPVRYAAWVWPTTPGGDPILEEEYTYSKIRLNVDLTDKDFDPDNPAYGYP